MKLEAEQHLWTATVGGAKPRDTIAAMLTAGMIEHERQALSTLEKWAHEGCYDYGVCVDLGWAVPGKHPRRWARVA